MRIRSILLPTKPTVSTLHTAVFAATVAQAYGGEWVVATAADSTNTQQQLQSFEWLNLFWDEGVDIEDLQPEAYTLSDLTPDAISRFDQQHRITHEVVSGAAEPHNPNLQLISLPALDASDLPFDQLRHGDYLPLAVWHYLLSLGWPPAKEGRERLTSYQVKQRFTADMLDPSPQTLTVSALRQINRTYISHLPADLLAEKIKPYLEEWFGQISSDGRWLVQLATIIRPHLAHFADAPDLASWAFPDGWELTAEAEAVLAQEDIRPLLVSLVAELAHIVLLDEKTAVSILNGLKARFPTYAVDATLTSLLTGQNRSYSLPTVMSTLGKAETLARIADFLQTHTPDYIV